MNDTEREIWLENDEWLYKWRRNSTLSKREFIRQNRQKIDQYISQFVNAPPKN